MNHKRTVVSALLTLALAAPLSLAGTDSLWIHVRVQDHGPKSERVNVNIPVSMIETMAPMLSEMEFDTGSMKVGKDDLDAVKLREMWKALRNAEEGEYVTIDSVDQSVRVMKSGDLLLVKAKETGAKNSDVTVKLPLSVVDALLSGEGDQLNFTAAIKALKARGAGELVNVNDDDSVVRIWIDDSNSGQ